MSVARERPVVFECAGERLVGVVHEAARAVAAPGVVIIVGGPQYRAGSHRQFVLMARDLASAGYPVFRFDYRGMGDGEGAPRSFEQAADDVRAAIDAFQTAVPNMQGVVLWGLCDAASMSFMYAHTDTRVRGMIVANPWVRTEAGAATSYLKHYYGQRLLQRTFWLKAFKGELRLLESLGDFSRKVLRAAGGSPAAGSSSVSFIERMRAGLQNFAGPTLILISDNDLTAQEFRQLCDSNGAWRRLLRRSSVRLTLLERADHTFSARDALNRATNACIEWLSVALPERSPPS